MHVILTWCSHLTKITRVSLWFDDLLWEEYWHSSVQVLLWDKVCIKVNDAGDQKRITQLRVSMALMRIIFNVWKAVFHSVLANEYQPSNLYVEYGDQLYVIPKRPMSCFQTKLTVLNMLCLCVCVGVRGGLDQEITSKIYRFIHQPEVGG